MVCKECGTVIPDGQYTCYVCGAFVGTMPAQSEPPTYQQPQMGQYNGNNTYQNMMNQPNTYSMGSYAPELGMKWYKFLIYFMLFFSCIGNIWNGINIFTGGHYDGQKDLVYRYYDGLQTVDMIMGVLSILLGVYALFVRFALADFKRVGPMMFIGIYVFSVVMNILYALMVMGVTVEFTFTDVYSPISMITHVIMISANYVYFKNRKHLFVN
ncbi:MAG: hypothetical protein IKJ73_02530 [Lachnospiraceae bacterium]|nr:hypothetical protein [Lachnospiraceae bacterium]